jgi:hypothetical protein
MKTFGAGKARGQTDLRALLRLVSIKYVINSKGKSRTELPAAMPLTAEVDRYRSRMRDRLAGW